MIASLPQQIEVKTKLMPNKVGALFMKPGTAKPRPTIEMVNAVEGVELYRLSLSIGTQQLSRAYLVKQENAYAAGSWVRKE